MAILEGNHREPICVCIHYDGCCLQTMTMKKIRHQLNAIFGVDLSDRKDFLAAQVCKQGTIHHLGASEVSRHTSIHHGCRVSVFCGLHA